MGRGNAICPDTSSRSHSIAVKSQNPGTAYNSFPAQTSEQNPRHGDEVCVMARTDRSGCCQTNTQAPSLANRVCLFQIGSVLPGFSGTGVARRQGTASIGLGCLAVHHSRLAFSIEAMRGRLSWKGGEAERDGLRIRHPLHVVRHPWLPVLRSELLLRRFAGACGVSATAPGSWRTCTESFFKRMGPWCSRFSRIQPERVNNRGINRGLLRSS